MAFFVYRASAGSGKTYTLVRTYLSLALSGDRPDHFRHILAITFTNKAAQEMKSRILAALAEISGRVEGKKYAAMGNELAETLGLERAQLINKADQVFTAILHGYPDFAISTIDAFVARIGRNFASELRLQQAFEIVLDQDELKQQSVEWLLARLGEDESLTETLVQFALEQTRDDKSWDIRRALFEYCSELYRDESRQWLPLLERLSNEQIHAARATLLARRSRYNQQLKDLAEQAQGLFQASGLTKESIAYGGNGILTFFTKIMEKQTVEPSKNMEKAMASGKWSASSAKGADVEAANRLGPQLAKRYEAVLTLAERDGAEVRLYDAILRSLYATATFSKLSEANAAVLDERSATTLPELYHRIGLLLAESAAPFIYERLGNRYRHFLIDEFQDTSLVQWQNLAPLVDNGLSQGYSSLLVGDAKQAIYRWRSGEAGQFVALPDPYGDQPAYPSFYNEFKYGHLGDNFRSGREIVEFNNALFRLWANVLPPQWQKWYEGLEQQPRREGGFVAVQQLLPQLDEATGRPQSKEQQRIAIFDRIVAEIKALLERGFAPGDMAVLVRDGKIGTAAAAALLAAGFPVVSADSLLLGAHPTLQQHIQVLRWLHHPHDKLAATSTRRLFESSFGSAEGTLPELFKSIDPHWRRERWLALSLYELGETVLHFFGSSQKADPFYWRWLDQLHEYSRQPDAHFDAWYDWWLEKGHKNAVSLPEGTNAVQIMTYHKAKGLEFPVVFLPEPDVYEPDKPGRSTQWIHPPHETGLEVAYTTTRSLKDTPDDYARIWQLETEKTRLDLVNLLYVACTRASEALYVYAGKTSAPKEDGPWQFSAVFGQFAGTDAAHESRYSYGSLPEKYSSKFGEIAPARASHNWQEWRSRYRFSTRFRAADASNDSAALRHGRLIHQLLAKLEKREELGTLLARGVEQGWFTEKQSAELYPQLFALLNRAQLDPYFDAHATVLNEAAILGPAGNYRPDRVVLLGNQARVLEYKTGERRPEHTDQLNGYLELLRTMGYEAQGELVYLPLEEA